MIPNFNLINIVHIHKLNLKIRAAKKMLILLSV